MEMVTLNDGNKIPAVGFGVFLIPNDGATYEAVTRALKAGYRHIDTAVSYTHLDVYKRQGKRPVDPDIPVRRKPHPNHSDQRRKKCKSQCRITNRRCIDPCKSGYKFFRSGLS